MAKHLTNQSGGLGPDAKEGQVAPARTGATGRCSPASWRSHPGCGSQLLGSPAPLVGAQSGVTRIKLPRTSVQSHTSEAEPATCLTHTVYTDVGSVCSMNVQTIPQRCFLLPKKAPGRAQVPGAETWMERLSPSLCIQEGLGPVRAQDLRGTPPPPWLVGLCLGPRSCLPPNKEPWN